MGIGHLSISALCTVLSWVGLQWWTESKLYQLKLDGSIGKNVIRSGNASHALELFLGSHVTIALLANFVLNVFILVILCLKTIFFGQLYPLEARKLVERLINYVIYKGIFLPLVIPPTVFQASMWSTWLTVLCSLKVFQALARDRLERLNASPSATPWAFFRVFSVLLLVLSVDFFWFLETPLGSPVLLFAVVALILYGAAPFPLCLVICNAPAGLARETQNQHIIVDFGIKLCIIIYKTLGSTMFLLLFFEPLSIAFETLQAIMVHGFQLLDVWHRHSIESSTDCQRSQHFDRSAAGSLLEWKGILTLNFGFFLDMMTLLMALGHYLCIWWLHGTSFHLVDAVLFLNIRALASTTYKRIRGFVKLRIALSALHEALPDATSEEIEAYDDECAICKEPMAKAKKLSCNHLFHLACLRSWLDQGLSEIYLCPTCRRPLFVVRREENSNLHTGDVAGNEQLAHQIRSGLEPQNTSRHALPMGTFSNLQQNPSESFAWRGVGLDSSWVDPWPSRGLDGAGPSTAMRSVGLGRVQMMMRHLASVGENYTQTALEDAAWSLWPVTHPQAVPGSPVPPVPTAVTYGGNVGGLGFRSVPPSANDNISSILAMADTVREVLPHIPDEIIFQDLRRTNSVAVTVNNLLQM